MATSIRSYGIWYRSGLLLVGLAANALEVALVTQAHLGTSPIAAIPYGMSLVLPGLSLGEWTIIFGLLLTIAQMVIEPSIPQWGSLGVQTVLGFLFGYAIDLFMPLAIRVSPTGYIPSLVMLLIGCVVIAVGAYLEVVANLAMLPGDAFIRSICRRLRTEFGRVRIVSDVSMSAVGALICWMFLHSAGSVREGTLISAVVVGLTVNVFGRLRRRVARLGSVRRDVDSGSRRA